MVENKVDELTDAEAEQYDRQIRLWGLDSQKRLRTSRVLVIGLKGLGAEIVKNVTLAGVKSITLLDDGNVSEDDACSQFLAPRSHIGKNRAEASMERTQNLNPMVKVITETKAVSNCPDEYFHNFEAICATECPLDQLLRLNRICREKGIKFFCGDVYGFFGFTFSDLQIHEYAEEITQHKAQAISDCDDEPPTKQAKTELIKTTVKKTSSFVPLQDALDVDWSSEPYSNKIKKAESSYFLMKVLLRFQKEKGRRPEAASKDSDIKDLLKLRDDELNLLCVPPSKIPDHILSLTFAEISPVCAIVGGVLAQEIIKALSQHEAPHNNMFFFNPERNLGHVECVGS